MQPRDLQRAFYEMLMESQFWSPQQLQDYQRSQLEQLLRHARKNVPFYEKRLDPVFTASGDIDWDRWEEIPIVKRGDMVEQREAMLASNVPAGHGQSGTISSSGSTGQPIKVTSNYLTVLAGNANRWRGHRLHNFDWSALYTARHDFDPRSEYPRGLDRGAWGPPWDPIAKSGKVIQLSRNAQMDQIIEFLQRTGTRYFSTGPKTIHVMALEVERQGLELQLDYVMPHGEQVSSSDRLAYKRAFGAKTLEVYSSKEGGQMGCSCPHGQGFHVNAESTLVEIVDDDGHALPHGESGRVVVTPFVSTAQPLIRYDQGDLARFGPPCPCGIGLPVLAAIEGRTTAIFTHPDGRTVSRMLSEPARELLRCTFWQIAQVGPLQFEVRYVPRDWGVPGDEAAALAMYRTIYFADSEVKFIRVREIRPTAAGKYLEYINEWSLRGG
jgi:phenylacetate-CoA ligase